jgi:hypothetical protein
VETVVELDAEALANDGLIASSYAPAVSAVWLRAKDDTRLLDNEFEIGVEVLTRNGQWAAPNQPVRFIRSPGRPEAVAIRFGDVRTDAVLIKMRRRAPGAVRPTVPLAEVWIGAVSEDPPGWRPRRPWRP